jgi:Cdc6-like AAA superfamily ATPase
VGARREDETVSESQPTTSDDLIAAFADVQERSGGLTKDAATAEARRALDGLRRAARTEALQDAQQIVAGDAWVDEARERHADRVSVGALIREFDMEIRETMLDA